MKVSIGSPCYDRLEPDFVRSLVETMSLLRSRGHSAEWAHMSSQVHWARNAIARGQLISGADVLVQADVDQRWEAPDLVRAIELVHGGAADVVGFAIPSRRPLESPRPFASPILDASGPVKCLLYEKTRYAEVLAVGGILVCSRECVERLSADAEPDLFDNPTLFDFAKVGGEHLGEDVFFCRRWRALGGKVHCDIDATVGHCGKVWHELDFESECGDLQFAIVDVK